MKKALVTGGAGFIGSHVVEELVNQGFFVTVVDNLSTGSLNNLQNVLEKINFIQADILDVTSYSTVFDKDTTVIHLAALVSVPESIKKPEESHRINVDGTHTLLLLSRNAKSFISASSAAVYGANTALSLQESDTTIPCSPYGLHKYINEQYGSLYSDLYNIDTTFLRFFNVYGPRQTVSGGYAAVIPIFIQKALKNESPVIFGDGTQTRDFVYVKDLAKILVALAVNPVEKHSVLNICTGVSINLNSVWKVIMDLTVKEIKPVYEKERDGDIKHSTGDNSKLKKILRDVKFTPFEEGIAETITYFESLTNL